MVESCRWYVSYTRKPWKTNTNSENQAIDRVHRLGQTRPVQVHRVYIQNSVEDRILALQAKKQQIADSVLNEGGTVGKGGLNQEDLLFLFDMDPERQPQNAA